MLQAATVRLEIDTLIVNILVHLCSPQAMRLEIHAGIQDSDSYNACRRRLRVRYCDGVSG